MRAVFRYLGRNAITLVFIAIVLTQSGPNIAHAVDEIVTGHIIFNGPGQNSARDIHTTGNIGGMRFYNATSLTAIPEGAAIQFYGNGHTGFPGQAFIDAGAHDNAAVIFRTAGTGQGIGERVRITAQGNVGIGTASPQEQLQLTGNLRLPATTATTGIIRSGTDTLLHSFGTANFFAGVGAGNLTMTGAGNTATGNWALLGNTSGNGNTAIGGGALQANTSGDGNTATGNGALSANTTGLGNTANGGGALLSNTTGGANTATGNGALLANTTGDANTATGQNALSTNTTGANNTASGGNSLQANTTGFNNSAFGSNSLQFNTTGFANTASGRNALNANTTGTLNTAAGSASLQSNTTGNLNTAIGNVALAGNTIGGNNTATGSNALSANTEGNNNTATGYSALSGTTTGSNNTALGLSSGTVNTTGSNNTFIGYQAEPSTAGLTNATAIGANATVGQSNSIVLGPASTSVGIGTITPASTLQVATGYVQIRAITSAPDGNDCNEATEAGRMVIRTDVPSIYICQGLGGWTQIT